MSLRKRITAALDSGSLRDFDAYAKPLDDFRVKTSSGATITLFSFTFILFLVWTQLMDWSMVEMISSLKVDKARKEKLFINLDLTFPKIPCLLVSLDVMDVVGEQQNNVDHSVHKTRLKNGIMVDTKRKTPLGDLTGAVEKNRTLSPGYCGSCYGGTLPPSGCCNTCEEVQKAYQDHSWTTGHMEKFEQCIAEGYLDRLKEQAGEGCRLDGHIEVSKVNGNFHFAPGKSFQHGASHVHDISDIKDAIDMDFSHTIHSLSFGEKVNFINPLDKVVKEKGKMYLYNYYIKVVGTKIVYRNGSIVSTNQFSATEHEQDVSSPFGPTKIPGVFFSYEISPMLVTYTEFKKTIHPFLD